MATKSLRVQLSRGIVANQGKENVGSDPVVAEMRNVRVNDKGHVVRRGGSSRPLVSASELNSLPLATIRAYEALPILTDPTATNQYRHFFAYELSTTALKRWDESSAWSEVQVQFSDTDQSFRPYNRDYLHPAMAYGFGRLFVGTSNANNKLAWIDLRNNSTPSAYVLGGNTNPPTAPTLAANNTETANDLTASTHYGFTYTLYNSTYKIETRPATVATQLTTSSNKTVAVTMTRDTDSQWDQFRIYRNSTGQTTAALATSATKSRVGTVTHTPGSGTVAVNVTGTTYNGNVAYTLGAAQDTSTHYPFGGTTNAPASFLAIYNQMLFGLARPRIIWHSRITASAAYPSAFPLLNFFEVGEGDDEVTGLMPLPNGRQLAIFTSRFIQLVQGTSRSNIDKSTVIRTIGCPFPRTIATVQDQIFFLGTDLQVWATDGQNTRPVSRRVNDYLDHIETAWKWIPAAGSYKNQYFLSFPNGTAIATSSANTTVAAGTTSVFSGSPVNKKITDGTAWDLSAVKKGMWAQVQGTPENNAVITSVNDGTDVIEAEDWRNAAPSSGDVIEVIANNRTLVYNRTDDVWYMDTAPAANSFAAWTGNKDQNQFFVGLASAGYVDQYLTTDSTDTGSVAITAYLKTGEIFFGRVVDLVGCRVFMTTPSALQIQVYINGSTTDALSSMTPYTPEESTGYFYGFTACTGHTFEVVITNSDGTALNEIQAVLLEYQEV
uniref:Uncharacterized protein n=1 Tax=viral metagenome TaxID=1070528 RepID=A0A6M3IY41_9ZZZZ